MFSVPKSVASLLLLFSSTLALSPSSSSRKAFVSTKPSSKISASRLESSTSVGTAEAVDGRDLPAWANLPSKPDFDDMTGMLKAEIWVGRLAMLGAAGLIARELGTGESFADQFMDVLSAGMQ